MIDLILNFKKRAVISQISLAELIETLKNPSPLHKKLVDEARTLDRKSKRYGIIKESLPCIVPNYNHDKYVKASTIKSSTGFIYIDVDDNSDSHINPENFDYIAAKWTSLSGKGSGYLVAVDNDGEDLTKEYLERLIISISEDMDIKPDLDAITRDRVNVIGYDTEVYFNPNYTNYDGGITVTNISSNTSNKDKNSNTNKKCSKSSIDNKYIRLRVNEQFYSDDIRYSNFDDYAKQYTFETDEVFKDLEDNKIKYAELFIPKHIENGSRNSRLYNIASLTYGLNPNIKFKRLLGFIWKINSSVCEEPLKESEIAYIVKKVHSAEPILFNNKEKRFLFNEDYMLTGKERVSIAVRESNIKKGIKTTEDIVELINNWDFDVHGKINYAQIMRHSGKSYSTVRRRKPEIDEKIKELKISYKNYLKNVA